jgi:MscS family membrane protein
MDVKTELKLLFQPILDWGASIDIYTFTLSLLVVVLAVLLRRPLAHWFLLLNAKSLRAMSIDLPENVQIELEKAFRVVIVCVSILISFRAINPPATIGDILQKLTLTVIVIAMFAAWYNLAKPFIAVLIPKTPGKPMTEIDWAVRVGRIVIIVLGIAAVLQLWHINLSGAITGVGVFGAGLAIAAQDLLRNLFAGASNVSEKRFETGDWIHVDGVVEGLVKTIDLRSTLIIGFDRIPHYVPNADLANATVQNLSRRDHRRVNWVVPLVLSSSNEQVERVCAELRNYLETSGDFVVGNDDILCLVQVAGLSDCAVEVKIYAFTKVNGYADYLKACERLTTSILQTVKHSGTSMAYPTHSLIVDNSIGNDFSQ